MAERHHAEPRRDDATVAFAVLMAIALSATETLAQAPRTGRLSITVADQTGAILPTANVRLVRQDGAGSAGDPARRRLRAGRGRVHQPARRALYRRGRVPGVRERRHQGRARAAGRKPPVGGAGAAEAGGHRHGAAGRAGRRRRSSRAIRLGADARADRRAVGRPAGDAPPAGGDGGRRRGDPRRQLRGRAAAAQVADPLDSRLARRLRRGVPRGRRHLHRHHHAAGPGVAARRHADAAARRLDERPQPVHAGTRARAHAGLPVLPRRRADQGPARATT